MLYSVQLMSEYEDSPLRFELMQWSIFLVPSVIIGFLVVTPFPSAFRQARHSLSGKKPPSGYLPTINILNAVFCLLAVALYLNLSAFPDYRNSRWNTDVQYQERLPIPSFAWIFMDDRSNTNDVFSVNSTYAKESLGERWIEPCEVWNVSDSNPTSICSDALEWITIGPYRAYNFNSKIFSREQYRTINDLQSQIWLRQYLYYNSSISTSPSALYQGAIVYDPDIMSLTQAWRCGLLSMPRLIAFGTNYVNMHLTRMQDEAEMFHVPSSNKNCQVGRKALFPKPDSTYTSWTWTSSGKQASNATFCDVGGTYTSPCMSTTVLSYDSQMIQTVKSQPGVSRLNVWLNAGSIIGGVQFFFWFMTMFAGY